MDPSVSPPFQKQKPSKSADESRRMELERLRNMTIEERVLEALSIDEKYSWIKPVKKESK